jgi:hypothetical protein
MRFWMQNHLMCRWWIRRRPIGIITLNVEGESFVHTEPYCPWWAKPLDWLWMIFCWPKIRNIINEKLPSNEHASRRHPQQFR